MAIRVTLDQTSVDIERDVFAALFDASVVSTRAPYVKALKSQTIPFRDLVYLSRIAQIPYTLFFAPMPAVERRLGRKTQLLLSGIGKTTFALGTRGLVQLRDVELIVKDILRKQELLKKHDATLTENAIVDSLKRRSRDVVGDAAALRASLGIELSTVRSARTKQAALDALIDSFEKRQIFVAQSQQDYMPQRIPPGVRFSGMAIKDKKIPFIFLTGGDDDNNFEPAGRKVLSLVLLGVCVARGRFAPVTYSDQTENVVQEYEYELAEEVLMPAAEIGARVVFPYAQRVPPSFGVGVAAFAAGGTRWRACRQSRAMSSAHASNERQPSSRATCSTGRPAS